ncbi:TerC family protein [Propionibacteriaceae bacterium G1746]
MNPPMYVWIGTVVLIAALLAFDFFFHVRKAHIPTLKEAAFWSAIYVGIAILFGFAVWIFGGHQAGAEYFAGYVTEKALSVDNLFVFLIIMSSFKVPRADQQKVLLFGIVFSLFARTGFIFLGAAILDRFAWAFYIFGLILIVTAGNMLRSEGEDEHDADNFIIRLARKFFRTTDYYDGDKLFTVVNGKRMLTPMLLVMVAIGGTDILFALDSIPAIFGLTQSTFIVFTATAFSLMGLRQLYFLIDGLLDRLIYLSYGLAAILAFIGVKLILHALHENNVPFINGGEPVNVVEIDIATSLIFIVAALTVTIVASLVSPKGKAQTAVNNARHHAENYLNLGYEDAANRETTYAKLVKEMANISLMPKKYRDGIDDQDELMELFIRARETHDRQVAEGHGSRFPGLPITQAERDAVQQSGPTA